MWPQQEIKTTSETGSTAAAGESEPDQLVQTH